MLLLISSYAHTQTHTLKSTMWQSSAYTHACNLHGRNHNLSVFFTCVSCGCWVKTQRKLPNLKQSDNRMFHVLFKILLKLHVNFLCCDMELMAYSERIDNFSTTTKHSSKNRTYEQQGLVVFNWNGYVDSRPLVMLDLYWQICVMLMRLMVHYTFSKACLQSTLWLYVHTSCSLRSRLLHPARCTAWLCTLNSSSKKNS